MRRAAKTDANQQAIVERLRACGIQVEIIGKPVDLLVCHRGTVSLMEVKNSEGKDRLTADQVRFIERWSGKIDIVYTPEEALKAVMGAEVMA